MKLVIISDTHGLHGQMTNTLPDGDVLIHCGDVSNVGRPDQILDFIAWFCSHPHPHKIFIGGNHDFGLENKFLMVEQALADLPENVHYLEDSGVEINGIKFWGMPWTPKFYDWAFMTFTAEEAIKKAAMIPVDTEVLISHGPPFGVLDIVTYGGSHVGCLHLAERLHHLPMLKLHAFGHIHEEYGSALVTEGNALYVNASTCTLRYTPTNPPIVVERLAEENEINYTVQ